MATTLTAFTENPAEAGAPVADGIMALVPGVVRSVLEAYVTFGVPTLTEHQQLRLFNELVALYLHLFDRIAFSEFGPDGRSSFVDSLSVELATRLAELSGRTLSEEGLTLFRNFIDVRQAQYSQWPELMEPAGQPKGGALIWESSKVINDSIGHGHPGGVLALHLMLGAHVITLLKANREAESA